MKRRFTITITWILVTLFSFSTLMVTAFADETSTGLTYEVVDGEVCVTGYNGTLKSVTIPSEIEGYPVTKIGEYAFKNSNIAEVFMPDSITHIGKGAFYGCTSLAVATIPEGVVTIEAIAFADCTSLTYMDIPEGVKSIGESAFGDCTGLKDISIPLSVEYLGRWAFERTAYYNNADNWSGNLLYIDKALVAVKEKSTRQWNCDLYATVIADSAFKNCKYLYTVSVKECLKHIPEQAFENCELLWSVEFNKGLESIGDYAFNKCSFLSVIGIPSTVKSIGHNAFYGCRRVVGFSIPSSVTEIGSSAFGECSGLRELDIYANIKTIPISTFAGCSSLTEINIPNGVEYIGLSAFSRCSGITSVTLPESVKTIRYDAFNCENLKDVYYGGTRADWLNIEIESNDYLEDATLHYSKLLNGYMENGFVYNETDVGEITIVAYTSSEDEVFIPSFVLDLPVTTIAEGAFSYSKKLRVYIPATITTIEDCAFNAPEVHVFYRSSMNNWKAISIGDGNDVLFEATRHYGVPFSYDLYESKITDPTCTERGYTTYSCTYCGDLYINDYVDELEHYVVDGYCQGCSGAFDVVESEHNYKANIDKKWTVYVENANNIELIFSEKTEVEQNYDYIYIYDKNNNQIGRYTGKSLASCAVNVDGDTAVIRLVSDGGNQFYGFRAEYNYVLSEATESTAEIIESSVNTIPTEVTTETTVVTEPTESTTESSVVTEPTESTTESSVVTEPTESTTEPSVVTEPTESTTESSVVTEPTESTTESSVVTEPTETTEITENPPVATEPDEETTATETEVTTTEATEPSSTNNENTTASTAESESTDFTAKQSEPVIDKGILGDINGDGKVNIKDATQVQKFAAKLVELTDDEFTCADVNTDAKVNIKDATAIQKFLAKLEIGLPIGETIA